MAKSFEEYKSEVVKIDDYAEVIDAARKEYGVSLDKVPPYTNHEIPGNLEREYFDALLDAGRIDDAKRVLERMKVSYVDDIAQNLVESYEYRLRTMEAVKKLVKEELSDAKKDFNQHTIALISIIVGVITILGAANQVFPAENPVDAVNTFFAICFAVIVLVFVALSLNNFFRK